MTICLCNGKMFKVIPQCTLIRFVKSSGRDFIYSKLSPSFGHNLLTFRFDSKAGISTSICNLTFQACHLSYSFHHHRNTSLCQKMSEKVTIDKSVVHQSSGHDNTDTGALPEEIERKEEVHTKSASESQPQTQTLSKRALKRQARSLKFKELKKKRKAEHLALNGKDEAGYNKDEFDETSYYFENGLRKVYPYPYVFASHAKGRWVGRTLKDILVKEFGFNHPSEVDKAFEEERIQINGHCIPSTYILKHCDYISHEIHRHENPVTDAPIEVIEDNDEVIVVNKPASIPCHPCGRYRYNSLVFILGKEMGYTNLRNIYRLDRLTSGVIILGKTAESTKRLEDQVVNREVQKEYVCRVIGKFPSETITVDQPLQALSNKLRLQIISQSGKASQTTFQRLSYNGRSSVVKCIPHTGRTHQIRVHLQYLGHPILNDVFYNSDAWGPSRGKGGVYDVSHEATCSQIYQTHQATQWEGGDNPLFYEKLKEMTAESEAQYSSKEIASPDSMNVSQNENENKETVNTNSSKTPNSSSMLSDKTVCASREDDEDSSSSSHNVEGEVLRDESMSCPSSSSMKELNPVGQADHSNSTSTARPAFDAEKLKIDHSCEMCRKKCLEPQQKHLVMFLHALKYKGPGWEYQTKLPDWANETWQKEDEFMINVKEKNQNI